MCHPRESTVYLLRLGRADDLPRLALNLLPSRRLGAPASFVEVPRGPGGDHGGRVGPSHHRMLLK